MELTAPIVSLTENEIWQPLSSTKSISELQIAFYMLADFEGSPIVSVLGYWYRDPIFNDAIFERRHSHR